jgi:Holliday junction resolvase
MLEKNIERRMCELIRKRGGLAYKFASPNNPGAPDRIVITPAGVVWFVELKTETGRLTKIQKHQKSELEKRNANVRVIYGWEAAKEFVSEVIPNGI